MISFDFLDNNTEALAVIDKSTHTICKTNESFRKMFSDVTFTDGTSVLLQQIVERAIRNMEDLEAMTMTCSMPINAATKTVRVKCLYADQNSKDKIIAVFDTDTDKTRMFYENYITPQMIPSGFLFMDIKSEGFHVIYANDEFLRTIGYTRNECAQVGNLAELIYEEDRQSGYEKAKQQIAQNGKFYIDGRIKCKNGATKWINMLGKEFGRFDGTKVFYVVTTDISESLQLKEQRYMEQQQLSTIEHVSKDITFMYDFNSEQLTLSGALLFKIAGAFEMEYGLEELLAGKRMLTFDTKQIRQTIGDMKAQKRKEFILNAQNRCGEKIYLLLDYYFINKQDDLTTSAIGVISDITEQVAAKAFYDKAITLWSSKQDDCVAALAINISTGIIISGHSKIISRQKPENFDAKEYSKEVYESITIDASREQIKAALMPKNLLKAYKNGQTHFSYDTQMILNGKAGWYQMTGSLHMNPKTGDLLILLKWNDINSVKLQQKISHLLCFDKYDFVSCIFGATDSYIMVSGQENNKLIPRSASCGYEATTNMVIDQFIDLKDKEHLKLSFSLKNLHEQLSYKSVYAIAAQGKYPDGSPAVKLNSFSYLDKQRDIILHTCIDITNKEEALSFRIEGMVYSVPFQEILYVESFGKHSLIITQRKKYNVNEMLSTLQQRLPGHKFMRCHRCYIVRYDAMQKIQKYKITMENGDEVPVNRSSVDFIRNTIRKHNAPDMKDI